MYCIVFVCNAVLLLLLLGQVSVNENWVFVYYDYLTVFTGETFDIAAVLAI